MKSRCFSILVSLLLAAACVRAFAGEFVSQKYGFKLVHPEGHGWARVRTDFDKAPPFALVHKASGRRFMVLVEDRKPHDREWDQGAIASLHAALSQALRAYQPVGRHTSFKGLPAYECSGEFIADDGTTRGRARITGILTERFIFFVSREKITADSDTDKDLGAMWQSFAFTTPPQPPPPPPPEPAPESHMGSMIIAAAVGALVMIVIFVRMLLLRRPGKEERRTKRMRYSYSEKAQQAAGASSPVSSPDSEEEFRRRRPPPNDLAQQEKVLGAAVPFPLKMWGADKMLSTADAPNPADFGKRSRKKPLKIDRRFIKNAPEAASGLIEQLKERATRGELTADSELADGPFQPLSEEQITAAEAELGFRLPATLRRVYREVANGGFGPSYGLLGLKGGLLNEDRCDAVGRYLGYREPCPDDEHWHWPEGLLPVGHLGCAMYLCVDCSQEDGPVIWFEPNPHEKGKPWDDSFIPLAASTETWLRAWLDGEDLFDKLVNEEGD